MARDTAERAYDLIKMYDISIIIPTYQRSESVYRVLSALTLQAFPPDEYEVIVSIDGSDDSTQEMVDQFPEQYNFRAIWQTNRGRAAACNAGIRVASGELLILLDDDMEPTPGFIMTHHQAHSDNPRLGVLGAAPISFSQSSPPVLRYIGSKFNQHLEKLAQPNYIIQIRDFYSGNFSIRREVLIEVGAFDEEFEIYGNEDGELAVRLHHAGVRLVYNPEAIAHQHYEKNFVTLARDNIAKGRTAVLCARKHPDAFPYLRLGTYGHGSSRWRLLRAVLLWLSQKFPVMPERLITFITWLEQSHPVRTQSLYKFALDYFFWWGAMSALYEHPYADRSLTLRVKSTVKS